MMEVGKAYWEKLEICQNGGVMSISFARFIMRYKERIRFKLDGRVYQAISCRLSKNSGPKFGGKHEVELVDVTEHAYKEGQYRPTRKFPIGVLMMLCSAGSDMGGPVIYDVTQI